MSSIRADLRAIATTLSQVDKWLTKAESYAAAKSFDPTVLLSSRLAPDQFPLLKQIQVACDWVKNGHARLAQQTPPAHATQEQTIPELKARIASVLSYVATFGDDAFAGAETRLITSTRTPGKGALGSDYLRETILRNFYFHATTAYAILRHNGVDLGKADFIGQVTLHDL
ncbi:MAG: hypothetical protein RLZZ450_2442 [Pseudomonadota bacterium]|jgi:hypothetical protein